MYLSMFWKLWNILMYTTVLLQVLNFCWISLASWKQRSDVNASYFEIELFARKPQLILLEELSTKMPLHKYEAFLLKTDVF
jgi:hypothetical protein